MISGYAEVMRDIPGENTPENVQIVIDEANRLTGIVNDLLDLSKLQAGALTLTVSEFNLTEDIRNTLHRYDKLADFSFPFTYDRTVYVLSLIHIYAAAYSPAYTVQKGIPQYRPDLKFHGSGAFPQNASGRFALCTAK